MYVAIRQYEIGAGSVGELMRVVDEEFAERVLGDPAAAAARPDDNRMPILLERARHSATEGEISAALQSVFGSPREAPIL